MNVDAGFHRRAWWNFSGARFPEAVEVDRSRRENVNVVTFLVQVLAKPCEIAFRAPQGWRITLNEMGDSHTP